MATVLVVEDESILRVTICDILSDEGFTVLDAGDGEAACKVLLENDVDLMLTDIQMPVLNGIKLTERAVVTNPKMKIVLMSGYASDIPGWITDRGIALLPKPMDFDRLGQFLRQQIGAPGAKN